MLAEDFMDSYNQRVKLRTSVSMNCVHVNEKSATSNMIYLNAMGRKKSCVFENAFSAGEMNLLERGRDRATHRTGSSSFEATTELTSTNQPASTSGQDQQKQQRRRKRKIKYRFRKENMGLYFAYEYVMFGLVLDRLFFWFYFLSTLLSYFITLYVFPFVMQASKKDLTPNVP